jgi:hypothetical protein
MTSVPKVEAPTVTAPDQPQPGLYRHFKGGEYEVLSVARDSETDQLVVVYHSAGEPTNLWVRPAEMFLEMVERPGGARRRFEPSEPRNGVASFLPDAFWMALGTLDSVRGRVFANGRR